MVHPRSVTDRSWAPAVLAVVVSVLGTGAFFAAEGVAQQVVYHCLSLASAAAVLLGVRLHRPRDERPWVVLSRGLVVMTVADVAADLVRAGLPVPGWLPVLVYVAAWGVLVHAVRSLARVRVPDGDRDAVLDATAIVGALALVLWSVLLDPALREQDLGATTTTAVAAFPLAQVALLAVYVRLLFTGAQHLVASWVLCVGGGLCGLAGSVAHVVLVATGQHAPGAWHNLLWITAYVAPGIAALVPDMRSLTEPVPADGELSTSRWTSLGAALLATTAATTFTAPRLTELQVFAVALPVPLLVLWRLRRVLCSRQQAVALARLEAGRHALVARLGSLAVAGAVEAVRSEACAALVRELDCEVRLGPPGSVLGAGGRVLAVAVGPAHEPWHVLEVALRAGRRWTDSEAAVVRSVANVLGAAEARHRSEQLVRWAASHDALTGLPNRASFVAALAEAVASARPGEAAVLFLDLDGFKRVNDTHGHAVGDEVLVATATRLRAACRDEDLAARLAGDEFVLLCTGPGAGDAADGLARRVRTALTAAVQTSVGELAVGISLGTATVRADDTSDELLRRADLRMYADKHAVQDAAPAA